MTYRIPGQRVKFGASELNRLNEAADRLLLSSKLQEQVIPDDQQAHWVWIRNDTGADRERFECVKLGDPLFEMLADGTVDLLFAADEADGGGTTAILLEPIAEDEFGKAVIHGLALAKVAGGTGTTAEPDASGVLEPGAGTIKLLASPHATEEKLLPVLLGAGGAGGESKFFRYTLTADMGTSSTTWVAAATANLVGMGNADSPSGVVVIDTLGHAAWQTTGGIGICVLAGGEYFVLTPECEPDEEVIPDPP